MSSSGHRDVLCSGGRMDIPLKKIDFASDFEHIVDTALIKRSGHENWIDLNYFDTLDRFITRSKV